MKKLVNVDLGGFPFMMNEDAYLLLSRYISSIEKKYKKSEGFEEITADIETRMAELIQEKKLDLVNSQHIHELIDVMGRPEDFEEKSEDYTWTASDTESAPLSKKLYRDTENKLIGGVCAGLAAYFGIKEPLLMRILFLFFVISGVSVLLYLILWIFIPSAKTAHERLSMKGETVNISSIAQSIEDKIEGLSEKINRMGKEWDAK